MVGGVVTALALSGCQLKNGGEDLVTARSSSSRSARPARARARRRTGVTGPNLDEAFPQARADGMKDSTFAGVVEPRS